MSTRLGGQGWASAPRGGLQPLPTAAGKPRGNYVGNLPLQLGKFYSSASEALKLRPAEAFHHPLPVLPGPRRREHESPHPAL